MKGIVESATWANDSTLYEVRVLKKDHTDENMVGHMVDLSKSLSGNRDVGENIKDEHE
jgi:hypothetical protein